MEFHKMQILKKFLQLFKIINKKLIGIETLLIYKFIISNK